jgi:hypothetical protein
MKQDLRTRLSCLAIALLGAGLSGCGGNKTQSCDEGLRYLQAVDGKRIESPEGLSQLDPMKEIPLPEASPRPPRPTDAPCLDLPPGTIGQTSDDDEQGHDEEQGEEATE